jgi:hypothetical protein
MARANTLENMPFAMGSRKLEISTADENYPLQLPRLQ